MSERNWLGKLAPVVGGAVLAFSAGCAEIDSLVAADRQYLDANRNLGHLPTSEAPIQQPKNPFDVDPIAFTGNVQVQTLVDLSPVDGRSFTTGVTSEGEGVVVVSNNSCPLNVSTVGEGTPVSVNGVSAELAPRITTSEDQFPVKGSGYRSEQGLFIWNYGCIQGSPEDAQRLAALNARIHAALEDQN